MSSRATIAAALAIARPPAYANHMARSGGFDGLKVEVLLLLARESTAPDAFVYHTRDHRPSIRVAVASDLETVALDEEGSKDAPTTLPLSDLGSPGQMVRIGGRALHLQFLRAAGEFFRGPLLIFEDGAAMPCFNPRAGLWQKLFRRAGNAVLPVYVIASGDTESRRIEIRFGLDLALALLEGKVAPGGDDALYYRGQS
jgi:hypothetical protein